MCGFAGFLTANSSVLESSEDITTRIGQAMQHRGPDDSGIWIDVKAGIAVVHRRLSIVDLSSSGHQPMHGCSGRYVIAFNGEIYNHMDLRRELDSSNNLCRLNVGWRGHSDTETLLKGFDTWGIQATVERCTGMFAFVVWDKHNNTLTLGRDRLGEKPLYYGWQGQGKSATFLFGSELKSLKAYPAFKADIDRNALCLLMRHNYIPAPYSIYQGISKLEAGCLLSVSLAQPELKIIRYWSATEVAVTGCASPFTGTVEQAVDKLEILLKSAVQQQMTADVPLGAFLSGGVDSSTVVALMQAHSANPVKTFTIGFNEVGYNEAVHAKAVAHHIGTEHTELYVSPQEALNVIPLLPKMYCEPFADSSQIPTFLVSQLARQQVKVSLSGDAD